MNFRVIKFAAHEAFDGKHGVFRVGDGLVAGHTAHEAFTVLVDGDHRGDQPFTFRGRNDNRFATRHDSADGVGCTEINTNDFSHFYYSPVFYLATRTMAGRMTRFAIL